MPTSAFLYHYTGADALLSIVTKGELWATDSEFMNDRFEGGLVNKAITNICADPRTFLPGYTEKDFKFLAALSWSLHNGAKLSVVSFSRHPQSLPQFRMYAPEAGGFSIGFPREQLQPIAELVDVEYSGESLWSWCRDYANRFIDAGRRIDSAEKSSQAINNELLKTTHLHRECYLASLRFKSDEFVNEAEVRLIVGGGGRQFRASRLGNYVMPYHVVSIGKLPMPVEVRPGPSRDAYLAQESLVNLLFAARAAGTHWDFQFPSPGENGFRA